MAQAIPFSQVVSVVPSVLSAGGQAVDLNAVMLTQNALAPYDTVLQFADPTDVGSYFGATSVEASLANIYFAGYTNGTTTPGALYFSRYPEVAIGGFLRSGSLASMSLAQLQALTGTIILTVGGTLFTSSTINLASATSFSNAATMIQSAFTSPTFTVSYSSISNAFIFTVTATGASSTITYATGTLSTGLSLTQATSAVLSQGAAVGVPATFMAGLLDQTQNFATLMTTWESTLSEKQAFATWSNSVQPRYLYVAQDSDVGALTANNTSTFGNYLQTSQFIGSCPVWGPVSGTTGVVGNSQYAAFICAFIASLNFNRLNGRSTLAFKAQSGLPSAVSSATSYKAILSNAYNCYAYFGSNNPANNANWMSPGSVSGSWEWVDTYVNQIWLNANIQLALVNLLQQVGSIPYNAQGYSLVRAAAMDPINAAINFGAIRKGVTLSSSEAAEVQYLLGFDASASITSSGFYLQIVDPGATVRAARQSPTCTLLYTDGQSIQQIVMASIEIE